MTVDPSGMNGNNHHGAKSRPEIVIVGGSLGGLLAGVALKYHGYDTTLLERTPVNLLHNQGAGITAAGDTITFFKKYDRTGKPVAVPSYRHVYLGQTGEVLHEEENRQNMTSWDLCYYLLRANYDRVDSPYLENGKMPEERPTDGKVSYHYGCTVTNVEDKGDKVKVTFKRQGNDGSETEDSVLADLVVAADGPSSTIRGLLEPQVKRKYSGYVTFRGTIPETEGSPEVIKVYRECCCIFHGPGTQNLGYTIAGDNGNTNPGHRLLNFLWYTNFPEGGSELEKIMTDKDGRRRRITIPPGMMSQEAWNLFKAKADKQLPPQNAEMVGKIKDPFIQCITDVVSPKNLYMGDKVVLVGDALAGFRPHTGGSTGQAAFDVMSLVDWLDGKIDRKQFVEQVMSFARLIHDRSVTMGNRSQYESLPLEEYIKDRRLASTNRLDEVYPEWVRKDLDGI